MSFNGNPAPHTPRPPNAFLCFRSRFIQDQKEAARTRGLKGPGMKDISRQAGQIWNEMSEEERRPFFEMAHRLKDEHRVMYPDYKFAPGKKVPRPSGSRPSRSRAQASSMGSGPSLTSSHSTPRMPTSSSYSPPPGNSLSRGPSLYLPANMSGANDTSSWDRALPSARPPQDFLLNSNPYSGVDSATSFSESWDSFNDPQTASGSPDFGHLCQWDEDFSAPSGRHHHQQPVNPTPTSRAYAHYRPY
ncbi:hypothetical protein B0H16DRAFT_1474881 [Mycena metata]|uniref:HMG box domain-containing protein n=1 Tax=Mycena metata TaxID=1033252 RepID=A0AAD7MIS4_9AGAR|nr:hypothetical protein B0H16DRAFT_1474881 [Mycena metata]